MPDNDDFVRAEVERLRATELALRAEVIRLRRELDGVCAALTGIEQGAVRYGANDDLAAVIAGAAFVMRSLVRPYDGDG